MKIRVASSDYMGVVYEDMEVLTILEPDMYRVLSERGDHFTVTWNAETSKFEKYW